MASEDGIITAVTSIKNTMLSISIVNIMVVMIGITPVFIMAGGITTRPITAMVITDGSGMPSGTITTTVRGIVINTTIGRHVSMFGTTIPVIDSRLPSPTPI